MSTLHSEQLETLKRLAAERRCAELHYRDRLTPSRTVARLVEPYALLQGTQDVLVRCYQLRPDEGWRTFMLHKIDRVIDTGVHFTPRQEVTIAADETPIFGGEPGSGGARDPWTPDLLLYRDLVAEALRHGLVDDEKLGEIRSFAERAGLRPEQARWVHAVLFQRCLNGVIRDGEVGPRQLAEIQLVQRVLTGLGGASRPAARGRIRGGGRPRRRGLARRSPGRARWPDRRAVWVFPRARAPWHVRRPACLWRVVVARGRQRS